MNIDIYKFGQTLKSLRQKFNYTQVEVTLLLGMNKNIPGLSTETLRRIEGGMVVPKLETLELLSSVYKQDLCSLFLEYRMDYYHLFQVSRKNIEDKLNNNEFEGLYIELNKLKEINHKPSSHYNSILLKQFILFTEAMILYKNKKDYNQALGKLLSAIQATTQSFNLSNYHLYKYSSMEIRILMNIALLLNSMKDKRKYKDILEFCILNVDVNDQIHPKLCHNLSGVYRRLKQYHKSLMFSDNGIESSLKSRNFNGLDVLYYGKGISEFKLGKKGYLETLNQSIVLSKTFQQDKMAESIINNCRNVFNIEIIL